MYRYGLLAIILLLMGCVEAAGETAVPTPIATVLVTKRPLPTISTSPPTLISPIPVPVKTITPIPTPLSLLLPAMINEGVQLSVKQSYDSVGYYNSSDNNESGILIDTNYEDDSIEIIDHLSNQKIFQLSNDPYAVAGHIIFQLVENDLYSSLIAYDLATGATIWEQVLSTNDWNDPEIVGDSILLTKSAVQDNSSTVRFFEQQTGLSLWQNQIPATCYSSVNMGEMQDTIFISCYDAYVVLNKATGELLYHYQLPEYTDLFNPELVDNQLVFLRHAREENNSGFNVENFYLQSVNIQDLEHVLWQRQLDDKLYSFEVLDGDIVYAIENQVVRLNGRNGELVWETELITHDTARMLVEDHWLFIGSHNGYLHLLDGETGDILWEQDIWATLQPRPIYVNPTAWMGTSLLIYADYRMFEMGLDGETDWEGTQNLQRPTPEPLPTQTPVPILPTLVPDTTPQAPVDMADWPAHILAYLNSSGTEPDELEQIVSDWLLGESSSAVATVKSVNLNEDSLPDLIVHINNGSGWVLAFLQTSPDQYEIAWAQEATTSLLLAVVDLNKDGLTDFIYSDTIYGASQSTVTIYPIGWQDGSLKGFSTRPILSTNVWVDEINIEDVDGDGFVDIVFRGGTFGSAAAGLNRESTFTYSLQDGAYELASQESILPQDYFFFVVDANQLLTSGKLEEAVALYEDTLDSEDAIYSYNAIHQRAFAEFQLMLAYLLLDDEVKAAEYAGNGRYQDQLYGEIKQIFWETYQATQSWTEAAEVARKHIRLAGYKNSQLVYWVGYANTPLTLNDIVPCETCLQGSIGSDYGP